VCESDNRDEPLVGTPHWGQSPRASIHCAMDRCPWTLTPITQLPQLPCPQDHWSLVVVPCALASDTRAMWYDVNASITRSRAELSVIDAVMTSALPLTP